MKAWEKEVVVVAGRWEARLQKTEAELRSNQIRPTRAGQVPRSCGQRGKWPRDGQFRSLGDTIGT